MSTPKPGRNTDQNSLHNTSNPASATPDQGRSAFSVSTTQGEENADQRSSQLGGEAYKQDSQADKGSNKESETARQNTKQGNTTENDTNREQPQVNKQREDINSDPDQGPTPMGPDEKDSGRSEHH